MYSESIQFYHYILSAMARVNMMKTIVTNRRQPHSPLDNVNTPYNPIRLLKGAPPGQEAVNHFISELSIEKKNNKKLADKERKHLVMLEVKKIFGILYKIIFNLIKPGMWWWVPVPLQTIWRRSRSWQRYEVLCSPAGEGLHQSDQKILINFDLSHVILSNILLLNTAISI